MAFGANARIPIESGWPGGPIYVNGEDDLVMPRRRTDLQAPPPVEESPPPMRPTIGTGMLRDMTGDQPPTVLTSPELPASTPTTPMAAPAPSMARYQELQNREQKYREQHADYDPITGDWKPKKMSRIRAIGLAALRGLAAGPGGAIGGALVGAISPGRVARQRYEEGLGSIRMEEGDALRRAQAEDAMNQNEFERTHPKMTPQVGFPEGLPEDAAQGQMYNRDPYGNLAPMKTPTGAPVYAQPKPIKPEKVPTRINVGEVPGLPIGYEYETDEKGQPKLDAKGYPIISKNAPPEMPTDQTAVRENAKRMAESRAAATLAAHHAAQGAEDEKNLRSAKTEVQRLDALIAPLGKNAKNLPTLQKQRADAQKEVERFQGDWKKSVEEQKKAEAERDEKAKMLPEDRAPSRTGYAPSDWPKGASSQAEAAEMIKRAKAKGLILVNSQGQPIQQ